MLLARKENLPKSLYAPFYTYDLDADYRSSIMLIFAFLLKGKRKNQGKAKCVEKNCSAGSRQSSGEFK